MTLDEIKKFLADNKDSADVKGFIEPLNVIATDNAKVFLESNDEGKKLLQILTDGKFTHLKMKVRRARPAFVKLIFR